MALKIKTSLFLHFRSECRNLLSQLSLYVELTTQTFLTQKMHELFSPTGLVSQVLCSKAGTNKDLSGKIQITLCHGIYLDDNVELREKLIKCARLCQKSEQSYACLMTFSSEMIDFVK